MSLVHYGFSLAGSSHVAANTGCQDSHYAVSVTGSNSNMIVAAVADGMGSARYRCSADGSKIATKAAVDFIARLYSPRASTQSLELLMVSAFRFALAALKKRALSEEMLLEDYSTTLTAVILSNEQLVYGHLGDGGIVGLDQTGTFHRITEQQKGEFCNQTNTINTGIDELVTGSLNTRLCSVLLMTDGVYEYICDSLMTNYDPPLRAAFLRSFMDNSVLGLHSQPLAQEMVEQMEAYFFNGDGSQITTDDITMLGIVDTQQVPAIREEAYYCTNYLEEALRSQKQGVYKLLANTAQHKQVDVKTQGDGGSNVAQK